MLLVVVSGMGLNIPASLLNNVSFECVGVECADVIIYSDSDL